MGGGARCPPTSARQIVTSFSGSAAQPSNGAAQSPAGPPAWQFNQPRRKLNFSTKHGRRQHQQDLRRARANRKAAKGGAPRLTQGVVHPRPAFDFAVPTVPVIAVMVSRGLFVFGAQQRDSLMGAEFGRETEQEREQKREQEREAVDTTSDQGMDSRRA